MEKTYHLRVEIRHGEGEWDYWTVTCPILVQDYQEKLAPLLDDLYGSGTYPGLANPPKLKEPSFHGTGL
mgnify:FL=1